MTADDRVVLRDHELVELLGDEPELLAILDAYAATQRRYWHETTRRRNRLVWALAAALALICAGGALAYAIVAGPLHNATLIPDATGPGACQLIGKTAADASTYFGAQGVTIWWRFSHWPSSSAPATAPATPGEATMVGGGFTSSPATVPTDSIVWNTMPVEGDSSRVIVFVEAPNDPNAPQLTLPDTCTSGGRTG
jgi:hypothetical protein